MSDLSHSLALDESGNVYLTGQTASPNFPVMIGVYDPELNGNNDVFVAKMGFKEVPYIRILEPNGVDDISNQTFTIQWTDEDLDDNAMISLYYDTDNQGANGKMIVNNIRVNDETDKYIWDTSGVPDGTYYIYAVIDDRENSSILDYSDGMVTICHLQPPGSLKAFDTPFDNGGKIDISWSLVPNDIAITGYKLFRSVTSGIYNYTSPLAVLKSGTSTYTDNSTTDGQKYFYVVRVYINSLESGNSNEASSASVDNLIPLKVHVDRIIDIIMGLPTDACVKNKNSCREVLKQKLEEVKALLDSGAYRDAVNKLQNDILQKTDGCFRGNSKNDWIKDCGNQEKIYPQILELIYLLDSARK
jgi:hypothetical protein